MDGNSRVGQELEVKVRIVRVETDVDDALVDEAARAGELLVGVPDRDPPVDAGDRLRGEREDGILE